MFLEYEYFIFQFVHVINYFARSSSNSVELEIGENNNLEMATEEGEEEAAAAAAAGARFKWRASSHATSINYIHETRTRGNGSRLFWLIT